MNQQRREQLKAVGDPIYRHIAGDVRELLPESDIPVCVIFIDVDDFFPWVARIGYDQEHMIEVNGCSVRALLKEWTGWGLNAVRQAIEKGVIA